MNTLAELARLHSTLGYNQIGHLQRLVASWGPLADLCFADLLLLVPDTSLPAPERRTRDGDPATTPRAAAPGNSIPAPDGAPGPDGGGLAPRPAAVPSGRRPAYRRPLPPWTHATGRSGLRLRGPFDDVTR